MNDTPISRGFSGRRPRRRQCQAHSAPASISRRTFPLLSAGPTPEPDLAQLAIHARRRRYQARRMGLGALQRADAKRHHRRHSLRHKLVETRYTLAGVSIDTLLDAVDLSEPPASFAIITCDGGYTTNVPSEDLIGGKAMIATHFDGQPLSPEHGGPARLLVPHLYFWKSAKWVRVSNSEREDEPGFWEQLGYHSYGDPWREQRYDGD